ncbi:hypothetical protein LUX39_37235 [Actinomadura madurae]|nr:hypothetical protein [Actinomadura madurae]MCQ0018740.1 hypothetical protein [Actinomadura madurae]
MDNPLHDGDPRQVGPYHLLGRLGGGMGQVFAGRSRGGRRVAVKIVRPELADDAGFRRRFAQEVAAARKVGGFYTAQVVDADPGARPPWLVTAFVPGPSPHQAVTEHGPLPAAARRPHVHHRARDARLHVARAGARSPGGPPSDVFALGSGHIAAIRGTGRASRRTRPGALGVVQPGRPPPGQRRRRRQRQAVERVLRDAREDLHPSSRQPVRQAAVAGHGLQPGVPGQPAHGLRAGRQGPGEPGATSGITCVAVSPDGRAVAAGGARLTTWTRT